jgi:hypothetical protein
MVKVTVFFSPALSAAFWKLINRFGGWLSHSGIEM